MIKWYSLRWADLAFELEAPHETIVKKLQPFRNVPVNYGYIAEAHTKIGPFCIPHGKPRSTYSSPPWDILLFWAY